MGTESGVKPLIFNWCPIFRKGIKLGTSGLPCPSRPKTLGIKLGTEPPPAPSKVMIPFCKIEFSMTISGILVY